MIGEEVIKRVFGARVSLFLPIGTATSPTEFTRDPAVSEHLAKLNY